jgi:hypothetical protein
MFIEQQYKMISKIPKGLYVKIAVNTYNPFGILGIFLSILSININSLREWSEVKLVRNGQSLKLDASYRTQKQIKFRIKFIK